MVYAVLLYFGLTLLIGFLLLKAGDFFGKRLISNSESLRAYECGFQPMCNARTPFSLQFYLVAIIFLLFDVELVLVLPFLRGEGGGSFFLSMFFVILLGGLLHESNEGRFRWRR